MTFAYLTDEELAIRARSDKEAEEALVERFRAKVGHIARAFPIAGIELEDRIAEGILYLVRALRSWQEGQGTLVRTYVKRVVVRRLIDLHRETRKESAIPASAIRSLDDVIGEDGDNLSLADIIEDPQVDIAGDLVAAIEVENLRNRIEESQKKALLDIASGLNREVSIRALAGLHAFAEQVLGKQYADFRDVLDQSEQDRLFTFSPEKGTDEARGLVRSVIEVYLAVQWLVLADAVAGYTADEIATRWSSLIHRKYQGARLTSDVVQQMVTSVREWATTHDPCEKEAA